VRLKSEWTEEDNAPSRISGARRVGCACSCRAPPQHSEHPHTGAKARCAISANAGFPQEIRRRPFQFLAAILGPHQFHAAHPMAERKFRGAQDSQKKSATDSRNGSTGTTFKNLN
jgi:hypothetical protein